MSDRFHLLIKIRSLDASVWTPRGKGHYNVGKEMMLGCHCRPSKDGSFHADQRDSPKFAIQLNTSIFIQVF
jgi:hypothetical protein